MVTGGTCGWLPLSPAELAGTVTPSLPGKGQLSLETRHQPQPIPRSESFQLQPFALSLPVFNLGYNILGDPEAQGLLQKPVESRELIIILRQ